MQETSELRKHFVSSFCLWLTALSRPCRVHIQSRVQLRPVHRPGEDQTTSIIQLCLFWPPFQRLLLTLSQVTKRPWVWSWGWERKLGIFKVTSVSGERSKNSLALAPHKVTKSLGSQASWELSTHLWPNTKLGHCDIEHDLRRFKLPSLGIYTQKWALPLFLNAWVSGSRFQVEKRGLKSQHCLLLLARVL